MKLEVGCGGILEALEGKVKFIVHMDEIPKEQTQISFKCYNEIHYIIQRICVYNKGKLEGMIWNDPNLKK